VPASVTKNFSIDDTEEPSVMMTSKQLQAYCARIEALVSPVKNTSNWATGFLGTSAGALIALASVIAGTDKPDAWLIPLLAVIAIFSGIGWLLFLVLGKRIEEWTDQTAKQLIDELKAH
jgi:hypothetical protein